MPSKVHHLLVARLKEQLDPFRCLGWEELPSYEEVVEHPVKEYVPIGRRYPVVDLETDDPYGGPTDYDWGRIAYFLEKISDGSELGPIEIDNDCANGNIYAQAVILDGCHRFAAAILAKQMCIPATYGGRIDLLEWLTGERATCPED